MCHFKPRSTDIVYNHIIINVVILFHNSLLQLYIKLMTITQKGKKKWLFYNYNIIIYHEFLPSPRRGSHVKSDNTHTIIIIIHPLAHTLGTCALIFNSCALFTVYPNRIMWRHPTLLQVITAKSRESGPKDHRTKQKLPRETHSVTHIPGLSTLSAISLSRSLHRHSSVSQDNLHTIHPV